MAKDKPAEAVWRLTPEVVARAARRLFKSANSTSLQFLCLKAAGATTGKYVTVSTADNSLQEALHLIAGQPEGFASFVAKNRSLFITREQSREYPGYPLLGDDGSRSGFYLPFTNRNDNIIYKGDAIRSIVYTNLDTKGASGAEGVNSHRASRDDVYEYENTEGGKQGRARFRPQYAFNAYWHYGPRKDVPVRIPFGPLAVWLHRLEEFDAPIELGELITLAINKLHITPDERLRIFVDEPFGFSPDDWTNAWDEQQYFQALCLPPATVPVILPGIRTLEEAALEEAIQSEELWDRKVRILGLRREGMSVDDPANIARRLVAKQEEKNLLFLGPPRTGKSREAIRLAAVHLGLLKESELQNEDRVREALDRLKGDPRFTHIQFHGGWSYGDFVRKIVPKPNGSGLEFVREDGTFLAHCNRNRDAESVFLIEEINRAPIADVFGEAFHAIERGYRGESVKLPASLQDEQVQDLVVPDKLLLIATANNLDRSTMPLDYALLGRFATVRFSFQVEEVARLLRENKAWSAPQAESFAEMLDGIAPRDSARFPLGHAYFANFVPPGEVLEWYRVHLEPTLDLFFTGFGGDKVREITRQFETWHRDHTKADPS